MGAKAYQCSIGYQSDLRRALDSIPRGAALLLVGYQDGEPVEIFVFGYSID